MKTALKFIFPILVSVLHLASLQAQDSYALDDAHNHDGSHEDGPKNCGSNYMLPGEIARLGSHSFIILGQDGPNHILADHRSGTPPHNYHYIFRIRLDAEEMVFYKKLESESKLIPAFTTIYYDDKNPSKQLDRTFFCLSDLPKIFGDQKKKGDSFEKLFPIRASLQKNADFEGAFEIGKSIYPGGHFTLSRDDFELIVYRYLPSYLEQTAFRTAIKKQPKKVVPLLYDAPIYATEPVGQASNRKSYAQTDGAIAKAGEYCANDYYLKNVKVPKTIHTFLLLTALDKNVVLAVHYYDQAPHNYQTALKIKLSDKEMNLFKKAKAESKTPLMLQTRVIKKSESENFYFCMSDIKKLAKDPRFNFKGSLYKNSSLNEYKLGDLTGVISLEGKDLEILTNRNLASLMNPLTVAKDVLGALPAESLPNEGLVDLKAIDSSIEIELRYFSDWNFLGRKVIGYEANKCLLTSEAGKALAAVQKDLRQSGRSLLVFDCYRPQRAVNEFMTWAKDLKDIKMKNIFYPEEPKDKLFERGYISETSGHSRGSTVDLTIIEKSKLLKTAGALKFKEEVLDCRKQKNIGLTSQLDMGTTYDCFSDLSNTSNPRISKQAQKNRNLLKQLMEKHGFVNYSKEWWHFTFKNESNKNKYFNFVIQ